jgi:uncharacterized protein YgiM (DUF1202 family)
MSGVEIITQPITRVEINGKEAGMTPYKNNSLKTGKLNLTLGDQNTGKWTKEIKLNKNISTVVYWTFDKSENYSGGYVLSMEKENSQRSGLLVTSSPNQSVVMVANEIKGVTPLYLPEILEGDKEIKISKPGYKTISVGVRPIKGFQVVIEGFLPREEKGPTPTTISEIVEVQNKQQVKILKTETGWLRVRKESNSSSLEIGRVNEGETYPFLKVENEWVQIEFQGKVGWVATKYVETI